MALCNGPSALARDDVIRMRLDPRSIVVNGLLTAALKRDLSRKSIGRGEAALVIGTVTETRSTALWPLRDVQCHGSANKRLQRLAINFLALTKIDCTPGIAFKA